MPDTRTRLEKLRAMARQTESPHEAEIAKRILQRVEGLPPEMAERQVDVEFEAFARAAATMGRNMAEAFREASTSIAQATAALYEQIRPFIEAQRAELTREYRGRVYLAQMRIAGLRSAADKPTPNTYQARAIAQAERQLEELYRSAAEAGIPADAFTAPRSPADERSPAGDLVTAAALNAGNG